jgi:hypothetical protein
MLFVNGGITGCAVNIGCGSDKNIAGAMFPGSLQDIKRTLDIGIHIGLRRGIAERSTGKPGEMIDSIDAFHAYLDTLKVPDVAADDVKLIFYLSRKGIQPAPGVEGIITDKGPDIIPPAQKMFGKMAADKAAGSGDEDFFAHGDAPSVPG